MVKVWSETINIPEWRTRGQWVRRIQKVFSLSRDSQQMMELRLEYTTSS